MYIDPMTLFITAEIIVVYIIINMFLFYKSRLYNVLKALLQEMRLKRRQREQQKQNELEALIATNKGLAQKNDSIQKMADSAGKTITDQLDERIETLIREQPYSKDLLNSVELDQSSYWLRLRLLELEKDLLSGNINEERWQELAKETIERVQNSKADHELSTQQRKVGAEKERYTGQLETDLGETQSQLATAKTRIDRLESELADLKSISAPSSTFLELPERGQHDDEIYQLKCNNFDLQESINKLKLTLQQADPSADKDEYIAILETQIANLEQYIKSADIAAGLMEKEISSAGKQVDTLQEQIALLGKAPGTIDLKSLKQLGEHQGVQSDTLTSIKDTIERLKSGEAPEDIAAEQEAFIARLEQIIKESEQCIYVLESELSRSAEDIQSLEDALSTKKKQLVNEKLGNLAGSQQGQKDGVTSLQTIINEIRGGGDTDALLSKQETEIKRLEHFLTESDTLISQLEAELDDLQSRLEHSQTLADNKTTERVDSNEDIEEMETLLQQFIVDTQTMLHALSKLEDENKELKAQITSATTSTDESNDPTKKRKPAEPPVMMDIEPTEEEKALMDDPTPADQ